jgi:[NiFe] hydrogenase assembly HybE family chaperone
MSDTGRILTVAPSSPETTAATGIATAGGSSAAATLVDPSPRFVRAFDEIAQRMEGLPIVNTALAVEAVGFAPWQGCWLGVLLTPWFMNLVLAPLDPAAWTPMARGEKRAYRFPAGVYDFIGANDVLAGEYQFCSLFSPVLQFDDRQTARMVAELARAALFDADKAERADAPVGNLSPPPAAGPAEPGPLARLEAALETPQSKRDFLRGRWTDKDRDHRG